MSHQTDYLSYQARQVVADLWRARMNPLTADDVLALENELRIASGSLKVLIDDIAAAKARKPIFVEAAE